MSVGSYHKQSASSGMISLQLDPQALKGFQDFTKLFPKFAHAAQRRAINKTLRWLRTHVAREVGRQERIAIAAVRQRLRAFPVSGSGQGKLWFGINPSKPVERVGPGRAGLAFLWRAASTRARSSRPCTAAIRISGYVLQANTSTRTATRIARYQGAVDDVLVGSRRTTVASRWPRRRSPWRTSGLTSRLGPIARTSAW